MIDDISAYLDDELEPTARTELAAALAQDPTFRAELDEVAAVRALVRDLAPPSLPEGFIESLLAEVSGRDGVVDLAAARAKRRGWGRVTAVAAAVAAAAAILAAVVLPTPARTSPALATEVRVHQAGTAAAGDPVSGLAPLATPLRFGR